MKKKTIRMSAINGNTDNRDSREFIVDFQIQIVRTLKKRGLLTENQCEKGIALLKGRS